MQTQWCCWVRNWGHSVFGSWKWWRLHWVERMWEIFKSNCLCKALKRWGWRKEKKQESEKRWENTKPAENASRQKARKFAQHVFYSFVWALIKWNVLGLSKHFWVSGAIHCNRCFCRSDADARRWNWQPVRFGETRSIRARNLKLPFDKIDNRAPRCTRRVKIFKNSDHNDVTCISMQKLKFWETTSF